MVRSPARIVVVALIALLIGAFGGYRAGALPAGLEQGVTAAIVPAASPRACLMPWVPGSAHEECFAREAGRLIRDRGPERALPDVAAAAALSRTVAYGCHVAMHGEGERYATARRVEPKDFPLGLLDQAGVGGCGSGFVHGMFRASSDRIGSATDVAGLVAVCREEESRHGRFQCGHGLGHAVHRAARGDLRTGVEMCSGAARDGVPCANGLYHDHWLLVRGQEPAPAGWGEIERDRATACDAPQPAWQRVCWTWAFYHQPVASPAKAQAACARVPAAQRDSCLTGAFSALDVSGPAYLRVCGALTQAREQLACVRGANIDRAAARDVTGCADVAASVRGACAAWFGYIYAAMLPEPDGDACSHAPRELARACRTGRDSADGAPARV